MNVTIDPELEEEFRQAVGKKFGAGKGSLGKAVDEALRDWVKKNAK